MIRKESLQILRDPSSISIALGMGGMLFSVALAVWQFEVPLRGSFWLLMVSSGLFMLVALAIGLLISIVSKKIVLSLWYYPEPMNDENLIFKTTR